MCKWYKQLYVFIVVAFIVALHFKKNIYCNGVWVVGPSKLGTTYCFLYRTYPAWMFIGVLPGLAIIVFLVLQRVLLSYAKNDQIRGSIEM